MARISASPFIITGEDGDTVLHEANAEFQARDWVHGYTRGGDFGGWDWLTLQARQRNGRYEVIDMFAAPEVDC